MEKLDIKMVATLTNLWKKLFIKLANPHLLLNIIPLLILLLYRLTKKMSKRSSRRESTSTSSNPYRIKRE